MQRNPLSTLTKEMLGDYYNELTEETFRQIKYAIANVDDLNIAHANHEFLKERLKEFIHDKFPSEVTDYLVKGALGGAINGVITSIFTEISLLGSVISTAVVGGLVSSGVTFFAEKASQKKNDVNTRNYLQALVDFAKNRINLLIIPEKNDNLLRQRPGYTL